MEKIKSVHTKRYDVYLYETSQGFQILYDHENQDGIRASEVIKDYGIASYLFDLKLDEFEGH